MICSIKWSDPLGETVHSFRQRSLCASPCPFPWPRGVDLRLTGTILRSMEIQGRPSTFETKEGPPPSTPVYALLYPSERALMPSQHCRGRQASSLSARRQPRFGTVERWRAKLRLMSEGSDKARSVRSVEAALVRVAREPSSAHTGHSEVPRRTCRTLSQHRIAKTPRASASGRKIHEHTGADELRPLIPVGSPRQVSVGQPSTLGPPLRSSVVGLRFGPNNQDAEPVPVPCPHNTTLLFTGPPLHLISARDRKRGSTI